MRKIVILGLLGLQALSPPKQTTSKRCLHRQVSNRGEPTTSPPRTTLPPFRVSPYSTRSASRPTAPANRCAKTKGRLSNRNGSSFETHLTYSSTKSHQSLAAQTQRRSQAIPRNRYSTGARKAKRAMRSTRPWKSPNLAIWVNPCLMTRKMDSLRWAFTRNTTFRKTLKRGINCRFQRRIPSLSFLWSTSIKTLSVSKFLGRCVIPLPRLILMIIARMTMKLTIRRRLSNRSNRSKTQNERLRSKLAGTVKRSSSSSSGKCSRREEPSGSSTQRISATTRCHRIFWQNCTPNLETWPKMNKQCWLTTWARLS